MKLYKLKNNIVAVLTNIDKKINEKRARRMLNKVYKNNIIGEKVPRSIK